MAYPDVNRVSNLNCSRLAFSFNGSGLLSAVYLNCGDFTPQTIVATGSANTVYTVVTGVSASVTMFNGTLSAGNQVGGFGQQYTPWVQAVTTVPVSAITGVSGNYLG
jgi:hypothetical protein